MADSEHLAKIKEGVRVWNDWRRANHEAAWNNWKKANPEIVPDLSQADLSEANLRGANLRKARLDGANLKDAKLSGANLGRAKLSGTNLVHAKLIHARLDGADLTGADLSNANLSNADLIGTRLGGANLTGARLFHANLSRADLRGTNLTKAIIVSTAFGDNDLSDVKGLETVRHEGPSTIGIDTIYRSHGKIPLAFLRGAGVPENFIEFMPSLVAPGAIQFYSCFISYSTGDQEFADRLHADLQDKGVRCWFAPHDIQAGKMIHEQIDDAIRRYERLLLILSRKSMKSKWVESEIVKARKREVAEKKRVLFPVSLVPFEVIRDWECFDSDTGEDLAREIRKYHIPDFSNWKNQDSYAKGLQNLLRDLKTEDLEAS